MPEKLPVPSLESIQLLTQDVGSVFQGKMNSVVVALRNALIAFNAQIDAAETASQQVEPAPEDVALEGTNNTYKMTPLRSAQQTDKKMQDMGLGYSYSPNGLPLSLTNSGESQLRFMRYAENSSGRFPYGSGYGVLINMPALQDSGSNYGVQIAMDYAADEFGFRRISGFWRDWCRMYHNRNIVGNVSNSAGIPTGALFQIGSGPAGDFVLYADGRMEATVLVNNIPYVQMGEDIGLSNQITWSFPIAFGGNIKVFYSIVGYDSAGTGTGGFPIGVLGQSVSTLGCVFYVLFNKPSTRNANISIKVEGRWY